MAPVLFISERKRETIVLTIQGRPGPLHHSQLLFELCYWLRSLIPSRGLALGGQVSQTPSVSGERNAGKLPSAAPASDSA